MLDIFISASLAALTILMAYLGVHVTLHPPNESPRAQYWYKVGFFVCGVLAVSLVITQGVRANKSQRTASNQIASLRQDIAEAVTGGNSYPEAEVLQNYSTDPPKIALTIVLKKAQYPESVKFRVIELDLTSAPEPCYNWEPGTGTVRVEGETGPIQPGGGPPQHIISLAPPTTGITNYRIRLEAKNGVFVQCLSLRLDTTPTNAHKWSRKSVVQLGQFVESSRDWGN